MRTLKQTLLYLFAFAMVGCSTNENNLQDNDTSENINFELKTSSSNILASFKKSSTNNINNVQLTYKLNNSNEKIRLVTTLTTDSIKTFFLINKNNKWEIIYGLYANTKDENYKNSLNKIIENKGEIVLELNEPLIATVLSELRNTPKLLFENLKKEDYYNDASLAIFWHLAIFNTASRAKENNDTNCHCSEYTDSLNEKMPFFCSEDKLVSKEEVYYLLVNVVSGKEFGNKHFIPNKSLKYLENATEHIQASEIGSVLKLEFKEFWQKTLTEKERNTFNENISSRGFWDAECFLYDVDSGGDCGCCGNYSGDCNYCHMGCYLHDLACEDCGWGCGPDCVEGPC